MTNPNELLRRLPSVEIITTHPALPGANSTYSRPLVIDAAREVLGGVRNSILAGGEMPADRELISSINTLLADRFGEHLREVINGTGVLVHTNLGRTPLPEAAPAPSGYCNLEYELGAGERGRRGRLVESMIARLARAEAALIVNNNAAAVYLILSGLAAGKEVVISRGELVQIGGGFRIPDILERSGAILREVGTTNKTTVDDYAQAIGADTALILKVHRSNFKMTGFVAEASLRELATMGHQKNIPVILDLGSGAVSDVRPYGLPHEPTLADAIADNADLVSVSGDKLFVGPQAGLIAGKKELIERLRKDPFYRALRPDKTTLAGLDYTARAHLDGAAAERLPLYRMLSVGLDKLRERGEAIMATLRDDGVDCRVIHTQATVGGGSLPEESFSSIGLEIRFSPNAEVLAERMRAFDPPVIGYITEDTYRLDLRTILNEQDELLIAALRYAHRK